MSRILFVLAMCCLLVIPILRVSAQDSNDSACPVLVENALALADDFCKTLGLNQACYGHTEVLATAWETDDYILNEPGELADLAMISSLATMPMDLDSGAWGVAVLLLQADLEEVLPGQAVTFVVYGETELRNAVESPTNPPCEAITTDGINVRNGPGTQYAVLGSLANGGKVMVNQRNPTGDWVQFDYGGHKAWLNVPLLELNCDAMTLNVVDNHEVVSPYSAPMQAFYLTTGLGAPPCQEAPRDGLLVQAPSAGS